MAGRGPPPKNPATRQRRNVRPGEATIVDENPIKGMPALPDRDEPWSDGARALWCDIWQSAQAKFWTRVDVHRIVAYVALMERFELTGSLDALKEARLQGASLGITARDRQSLGWIVSSGEKAKPQAPPQRKRRVGDDPRLGLRAVK